MNIKKSIDVVFINPSVGNNYQSLKSKYTAIEPPTWSLLLAQSMRSFGFDVSIIDANAENKTKQQIYEKLSSLNPKLVVFVVYGQNVNAGTTNMEGALTLSKYFKLKNSKLNISYIGSYVQAVPVKALKDENSIDFVFTNEGVYALKNVLRLNSFNSSELKNIKGIAFRDNHKIIQNQPEIVVPNERMDLDLPGYAWDLLPFENNPLDLYRAPMWHA